jgi:hypothetical protein
MGLAAMGLWSPPVRLHRIAYNGHFEILPAGRFEGFIPGFSWE